MMQNIFLTLFLSLSLAGCYDVDSSSNNADETTFQNESTDYQQVIARLEGKASTPDEYFELADAYLQKSGLTYQEMIDSMSSQTTVEKEVKSPFMAFVGNTKTPAPTDEESVEDLNKATDYYMQIIGNKCTTGKDLNSFEKEVCLYKGLEQTIEVADTINSMSDDVSTLDTTGDEKLQASSCAMQYAFNGIKNGCSITEVGPVTFQESNTTYDKIDVYSNGKEYSYLLHENNATHTRELVVTDGYCSTESFTTREPILTDPDYYPCPVTTTPDEPQVTTSDNLINSLNQGTDTILAVTDSNSELAQTVEEFKIEISSVGKDDEEDQTLMTMNINMQDMIEYLNAQNVLTH